MKKAIITLALVLMLVAAPVRAAGLTEAQIQAILGLLVSFDVSAAVLTNVETALRGGTPSMSSTPTPAVTTACSYATKVTLSLAQGASDAVSAGQVTYLQKFLALDPAIYPEGLVTGTFGPVTAKAVVRFQVKNGVLVSDNPSLSGYGIVGTKTRAAMQKGCAPAAPGTQVTPTPSASTTPAVIPATTPTVTMKFRFGFVQPGQPAVLEWTSINATRCSLDDGTTKFDVPVNGTKEVYPSGVSSYKMSCVNDADPYHVYLFSQTLTASSTTP